MNIKMVDLGSQYNRLKTEIDGAIQSVIDSQQFIGGKTVSELASNLEVYNKVKYVIPCGNGTDALQIALMALDFKPGSEVIVPSFTFVATAETIALLGLTPVFVDVDPDSFTIDINKIKAKISTKTVAILPVHLYGQNADMQAIIQLAKEYNLKVIEDAAQSIGSDYFFEDGRKLKSGTIGHIGTTSFFPSKNLGAYGDGGAIFTNDENLALACKQIANHGQSKKYFSNRVGINSRLDALQAAILGVKLKYLDEFNKQRKQKAEVYDNLLKHIEEVTLPKRVGYSEHVFHQYTIKVPKAKRNDLKEFLLQKEVPTMIYYPVPIHQQAAYFKEDSIDLKITESLSQSVISLPIHPDLPETHQKLICNLISDFFSK